jgi:hypothetical protein
MWVTVVLASIMAALDIASLGVVKSVFLGNLPMIAIGVSLVVYSIQIALFFFALNFEGMAVLNLLWDVLSDIFVTAFGILYFKEKLTSKKAIGFLFSAVAIFLLTSSD